jgi:hypothetical protein
MVVVVVIAIIAVVVTCNAAACGMKLFGIFTNYIK